MGKGVLAGGEVGGTAEARLLWGKVGLTQPDLPGVERFLGCRTQIKLEQFQANQEGWPPQTRI